MEYGFGLTQSRKARRGVIGEVRFSILDGIQLNAPGCRSNEWTNG
jgi:hypothetical protein